MLYFIFHDNQITLQRLADGTYTIPSAEGDQLPAGAEPTTTIHEVTPKDGSPVVKTCGISYSVTAEGYEMCPLRQSYYKLPRNLYLIAGKCAELLYWDRNTQYCGICGAPMKMHTDISKQCTNCHHEVWPQLQTAVITLVHRGDEILLVHARNFRTDFYGLVAGFVETGETLEQAAQREILEETGIKVKNIRYFKSQPWPYPCGLMVGFMAEYAEGDIHLQESEISKGGWFNRHNLPTIPEKLSIARMLIDHWLEQFK